MSRPSASPVPVPATSGQQAARYVRQGNGGAGGEGVNAGTHRRARCPGRRMGPALPGCWRPLAAGHRLPGHDPHSAARVLGGQLVREGRAMYSVPDKWITATVDVGPWLEQKLGAWLTAPRSRGEPYRAGLPVSRQPSQRGCCPPSGTSATTSSPPWQRKRRSWPEHEGWRDRSSPGELSRPPRSSLNGVGSEEQGRGSVFCPRAALWPLSSPCC
jgi:hypothetical protein